MRSNGLGAEWALHNRISREAAQSPIREMGVWVPCGLPKRDGTPCQSVVRIDLGHTTCWNHRVRETV